MCAADCMHACTVRFCVQGCSPGSQPHLASGLSPSTSALAQGHRSAHSKSTTDSRPTAALCTLILKNNLSIRLKSLLFKHRVIFRLALPLQAEGVARGVAS